MEQKEILQQFHTFYDTLPEGICLVRTDEEETLLFANRALLEIFQCTCLEEFCKLARDHFQDLVDPADYKPLALQARPHRPQYVAFRVRTYKGHYRKLEGFLRRETFPEVGDVWILSLTSNLEKVTAMKHDTVTGLMGLHAFYQKARDKAVQKCADGTLPELTPVYLNITNFKLYNVTHGIPAGDKLLRFVGQTLQAHFPGQLMARISGDSFALLVPSKDLLPTLVQVIQTVDRSIGNPNITLKAGIYRTRKGQSVQEMLHTFDMAQMACNSVKKDANHSYAFYSPELAKKQQLRSFVLENFQKALDAGRIQVYFQPVVRTLTGKLCGLEALARWIDPEKGLISPGVFVPVLEETRLIHKLDAYILDQVGRQLQARQQNRQPLVPISCNFSRLDFLLTDPFQLVEETTRKYQLQRSSLCIEVTESALIHDTAPLRNALNNFHRAGYQLWLDDFGSAYSSLNVLHSYHFDELKIDMGFWQDLNEKGKKIITSIVLMAKTLGIHTLAEGVETGEQVAFLKKIGCEKIQGYYYGQPLPYEDLLRHLQNKGILTESALEGPLFDKAGLVNVLTDTPISLFQYNGEQMTLLFINEAYEKSLQTMGLQGLAAGNRQLHTSDFPQRIKIRVFLDKTMESFHENSMIYVDGGQYFRFRVKKLAGANGQYLCRGELHNITFDPKTRESRHFDKLLRNLLLQYDGILYLDLKQDALHVTETSTPGVEGEKVYPRIQDFFSTYARIYVYPEDRQRFLAFFRPESLHRQARASGRSEAVDLFRIKQENGNFKWMVFHAIILHNDPSRNILVCIRGDLWEQKSLKARRALLPEFVASLGCPLAPADSQKQPLPLCFWDNAIQNSPLKYFWKDNCRRFLGASQAFLDYYGLKAEDLIGKTDEDMGWHPDPEPFRQDELQVLLKGTTLTDQVGHCIIHGVPHTILATKYPMYKDNKIVGLIGYFEDLDRFPLQKAELRTLNLIDPETGFPSYRGMLETGIRYADAWLSAGRDYLGYMLSIPEYETFRKQYGEPLAQKLLVQITHALHQLDLHHTSLSRVSSCRFLGFTSDLDVESLHGALQALAQAIHAITSVDDCPCTLYLQYAVARGSEAQSLDNLLTLLTERLNEAQNQKYGQSVFIGDRIAFELDKFDTMDELVLISDPETLDIVYMNQAAMNTFGLEGPEDYRGKKCYEIMEDRNAPCSACPRNQLRQDRFHTVTYHNPKVGRDLLLRDTLVPWRGRTLHFVLGLDLNKYVNMDIARNELLFREASINDMIAIGLREEDPDRGIRKMMDSLAQFMKAERFYIFEENPDGTISATYEWKAKGLPPLKDRFQRLHKTVAQPLYDAFDQQQMVMLPDVPAYLEALKGRYPQFRATMPHLRRLVSGHLTLGDHSLGFTEVLNPSAETFQSGSLVLATITRFFAILLRNRDTRKNLETISSTDALTRIGNRYAFHNYVKELAPGQTLVFLFGDINGLKRENDLHGHEAGDHLIIKASRILVREKGPGQVFRMGGDEFLLIAPCPGEEQARQLLQRVKERCQAHGISMALGFSLTQTPIIDLDAILSKADHAMYKDKGVMYGRRSTDR